MSESQLGLIRAQKASAVLVVVAGLYPQKALAEAFRLVKTPQDLGEEHFVSALLDETFHPNCLVRFAGSRGSSGRGCVPRF